MNITEKEFGKLKQLDRIEYRQKRDYISRVFGNSRSWPAFKLALSLWILIFLITDIALNNNLAENWTIARTLAGLIQMSVLVLMIGVIWDFVEIIISKRLKRELEEKYFKIEVKHGKRKS
jgi:hypothetical protein